MRPEPLLPLLRNVNMGTQPRVLPSSRAAGSAVSVGDGRSPAAARPAALAVVEPVAEVAAAHRRPESLYEEACARGYQEGLEAGRKEGREEGHEEGRGVGLQQGLKDAELRVDKAARAASAAVQMRAEQEAADRDAQWSDRIRRLESVVEAFTSTLQQHVAGLESDAVALAFEVVCRVLGDSLTRRDVVSDLVSQALARLGSQPLRVYLNATDLALLSGSPTMEALRARYPQLAWCADERVAAGGCLVDSGAGTLDARLDTQLQRLLQAWREGLASAASASGAAP